MKSTAVIGMFVVSLNCVSNAQSLVPHVFALNYSWMWYIAAFGWFVSAVTMMMFYSVDKK